MDSSLLILEVDYISSTLCDSFKRDLQYTQQVVEWKEKKDHRMF